MRETSIGCWGCFGRKWKNISYWWKLVYVWQKQMMTIWLISWLKGEILSCMDCLYFPISNIQNYPTFLDRVGSLIDNLEYLRWLYWFATNRKTNYISCSTIFTHPGLGDSSFNSPRQKSGLVHKGGGGGTLSPDFSWEPFFGHFLGLFKAFLGLFTTWWPLKNSLESRKGRGGGGGQKVWTSPDFCRGELNDESPKYHQKLLIENSSLIKKINFILPNEAD